MGVVDLWRWSVIVVLLYMILLGYAIKHVVWGTGRSSRIVRAYAYHLEGWEVKF